MKMACHLLQLNPGDRLPTVSEYCTLLDTGSGTVQAAIRVLMDGGAVTLESRGHQGTYVVDINRSLLWRYSFSNVFFGSMPLPYTDRLLGLATALYEQFEQVGIPFSLAYVRGSRWRVKRLLERRTDFIVCSQFSFKLAMQEKQPIIPVMKLGEETYNGQIMQVFSNPACREIRDGMQIGIDEASYDQEAITRMVCRNKNVKFIPLSYTEIFPKLRQGVIDATYWNMDEIKEKQADLLVEPITGEGLEPIIREIKQAVILTREENTHYVPLVQDVLNLKKIQQIQQEIIKGRRIPSY